MNLNPNTSMNNESKHRSVLRFASRAAARNVPANEVYVAVKKQFGAQIAQSRNNKRQQTQHQGTPEPDKNPKINAVMLRPNCITHNN